jgi:hypothetical protein
VALFSGSEEKSYVGGKGASGWASPEDKNAAVPEKISI